MNSDSSKRGNTPLLVARRHPPLGPQRQLITTVGDIKVALTPPPSEPYSILCNPLDKERFVFTVSAKGIYGLTAIAELGLQYQSGPTQIKDIAERHNIPQHYLEQILVVLKKAGFVESYRGAQGGYALAKDPSRIRIQEVLAQLEGALEIVPEGKRGGMLAFFWEDLYDGLKQQLDKTLEDILLEQQRQAQKFTYSI